MNEPYRTAAIVPVFPAQIVERLGELMSKWTLNGVTLQWNHGEDTSVTLRVEGPSNKVLLDVDELRELAMMIGRAIDEVSS